MLSNIPDLSRQTIESVAEIRWFCRWSALHNDVAVWLASFVSVPRSTLLPGVERFCRDWRDALFSGGGFLGDLFCPPDPEGVGMLDEPMIGKEAVQVFRRTWGTLRGRTASRLVIETVETALLQSLLWHVRAADPEQNHLFVELQQALGIADDRLFEAAQASRDLHAMGSTLTIAVLLGSELMIVHAGDTRCYLLRGGDLLQITRDHTLAA